MHMARLWNSGLDKISVGSVATKTGYSLAALSGMLLNDVGLAKTSMSKRFADHMKGAAGPDVLTLQTDPELRQDWIRYSALDAQATWWLYNDLTYKLSNMPWSLGGGAPPTPDATDSLKAAAGANTHARSTPAPVLGTMLDFYNRYFVPFADCLTGMEQNGIRIKTDQLHLAEEQALKDLDHMRSLFQRWVRIVSPVADLINPSSSAQMQQLLFGSYQDKQLVAKEKEFVWVKPPEMVATEQEAHALLNPYRSMTLAELNAELKVRGLPPRTADKTKAARTERLLMLDAALKIDRYAQCSADDLRAICSTRMASEDLPVAAKKKKTGAVKAKAISVTDADAEGTAPTSSSSSAADIQYDRYGVSRNQLLELLFASNQDHVATMRRQIEERAVHSKVSKNKPFVIETVGLIPEEFTPKGAAQVSTAVLRRLAGSNLDFYSSETGSDSSSNKHLEVVKIAGVTAPKYGAAYTFFKNQALAQGSSEAEGDKRGREACLALGALANSGQIETTISTFLKPLQSLVDSEERIHCSLNMNTETGRLSSRRPNLQNQPALEKDQYKIRDAFIAREGNTLIVADYGQLELRVLAHVTNCKSMIEAFKTGGCFHSRTAMGMYAHVRQAVERGEVLLEAGAGTAGSGPPLPLVKDVFAAERRLAKTLNFSIAYGKTVHGLAIDW